MMKNVSQIGNKTQELPAQIILRHRVVLIIERIQLLHQSRNQTGSTGPFLSEKHLVT